MYALLKGEPSPTFEGTIEEHMAKYHPDPAMTKINRQIMEKALELRKEREDGKST
jgi:hypothetical protein